MIIFYVLFATLLMFCTSIYSHCQIPCGIYDDNTVFNEMQLNLTTIDKSVTELDKLSSEKDKNYNQIVRWINEKDRSADEIIEQCSEYFLTQRLKDADGKYVEKLKMLHNIMTCAVKAKQSTDSKNVVDLSEAIKKFKLTYFSEN